MSISTTTNRNDYTGNGVTTEFAYTFRIIEATDLVVKVRNTNGAESTLTLNTDYTVDGVGEATGTITLEDPLEDDYALTIRRVRPLTQETDIRNQGEYYAELHEDAFDHGVMIDQQQQDELDRSLKTADTEADGIGALPLAADRANKFLAFDDDGHPIASDSTIDSEIPVTEFGEDLVQSANATAALTELGVSSFAQTILDDEDGGDVLDTLGVSAFAQTLLDDADAETARTSLGFTGADGTVSKNEMDATTTSSSAEISNLGIACSVGSNALTIALTQAAGTTPTAASPVTVGFRSSTGGQYVRRQRTSALSLTISSGSTLGTTSGDDCYIYVYAVAGASAIDDIAVSLMRFDEGILHQVTAEGGAGAADSSIILYGNSANIAASIRLIGRLKVNQITAGTWASAPTEISLVPFQDRPILAVASRSSTFAYTSTPAAFVADTEVIDTHSAYNTSTGVFVAPEGRMYEVGMNLRASITSDFNGTTETIVATIEINSGATSIILYQHVPPSASVDIQCFATHQILLNQGDQVTIAVSQTSGASRNIASGNQTRIWFKSID